MRVVLEQAEARKAHRASHGRLNAKNQETATAASGVALAPQAQQAVPDGASHASISNAHLNHNRYHRLSMSPNLFRHPASTPLLPRRVLFLALAGVALILLSLLSLSLGAKPIALSVVLDSLRLEDVHPDSILVLQSRLPRTLLGALAGAALALAGALMQALTRNPLADPGILGVNAGASFAVILGVALLAVDSPAGLQLLACIGALSTTVLVYLLSAVGAERLEPMRFILAGVAIGALLMGLATGITLLDPATFDRIRYWSAGTLDVRNLEGVLWITPTIVCGGLLALSLARPLNALSMGEDLARSLGTRPRRTQVLTVAAITLLCGASTAVAGPIGFIGLMIPALARWLMGSDLRWSLPLGLLLGPCLLLLADIIGRLLVPGELRVSIVTAFVGAPVLIWLARRG